MSERKKTTIRTQADAKTATTSSSPGDGLPDVGIYPYRESRKRKQRAVVGLIYLSARVRLNRQFTENLMTFASPLAMFEETESNGRDCFRGGTLAAGR